MRRVLFSWRGVRIYSYPAMLFLGISLGMAAGNYAANLTGLDSARVLIAMVLLTIPALIGARLLFVVSHWGIYRREPGRLWRRSEGGAAMLGGLPVTMACAVPLLGWLRVPFYPFWDVATFTMLIALVVTRVGCLLHGCCGGRPTDRWFGLRLPDHCGVWRRRIPVQILDAGLATILLAGAAALWRVQPFPGAVFLSIVAVYSLIRFVLQPAREAQEWLGAWNVQRAVSAALAALALAGLLTAWAGATGTV